MLYALKNADCVCGTRAATRGKGDNWVRIVSSRIANWVRNKLSGEEISDAGCTYRVFKRECIARVKFFNGAHRFLPTLIKMEGFRVVEVLVSTSPRLSGASHYGLWNRLFKFVPRPVGGSLDEVETASVPNRRISSSRVTGQGKSAAPL